VVRFHYLAFTASTHGSARHIDFFTMNTIKRLSDRSRHLPYGSHTSEHFELSEFNKRRVFIALYEREGLSVGECRRRLGHAAYHWEIIVAPKEHSGSDCYTYGVTNRPIQEGKVHTTEGICGRLWRFREEQVNPDASRLLVGMIMIGKIPSQVTREDIKNTVGPPAIRLPDKQLHENCATWIKEAIERFQEAGLSDEFDVQRFMDDALAFADHYTKHDLDAKRQFSMSDHCFVHPRMKCAMLNYTQRRMW
jgi:hypothetical protein